MTTLNVSLSPQMKDYIESQVKSGRFNNSSEVIRDLIRQDQNKLAREQIEQLLIDGINSGTLAEMSAEDWNHIRSEIKKRRYGRRRKSH